MSILMSIMEILLFLGYRSLIKNKTQTAVINILNLHILIDLTYIFKNNRWNLKQLFIYNKGEGTGT